MKKGLKRDINVSNSSKVLSFIGTFWRVIPGFPVFPDIGQKAKWTRFEVFLRFVQKLTKGMGLKPFRCFPSLAEYWISGNYVVSEVLSVRLSLEKRGINL